MVAVLKKEVVMEKKAVYTLIEDKEIVAIIISDQNRWLKNTE